MQLSSHFTLEEFMYSETAIRLGIDMTPNNAQVMCMIRLCENVLEPLRMQVGKPIKITSGFRPPALNKAIGGAANSAHQFGCAADTQIDGMTPLQIIQLVKISAWGRIFVDQGIEEFGSWAHLAVAQDPTGAPRNDWLRAVRGTDGVVYSVL